MRCTRALAHVVAGVIERKPMMIADASEILDQIQLASSTSDNAGHFSTSGERRLSALLGQIEEAEHSTRPLRRFRRPRSRAIHRGSIAER